MLEIVSFKNNIITESIGINDNKTVNDVNDILAPGRFDISDDWDAGY